MILTQWHKPCFVVSILTLSQLLSATSCGAAFCQGSSADVLKRATYLHSIRRFPEELSLLDTAVKQGDRGWPIYRQRALTYLKLNELDKALGDLDEAVKLAPKQAELLYLHGNLDTGMMEDERAVSYYTRAMTVDPRYTDCLLPRATAYQQLTKFDLAVKDVKAYLTGRPERHTADVSRTLGHMYLQNNQLSEAVKELSWALAQDPKIKKVHSFRGDAYMLLKDYKAAIADYSEALKQSPTPELYAKRAQAYEKLGQPLLAAKDRAEANDIGEEAFEKAPFRTAAPAPQAPPKSKNR